MLSAAQVERLKGELAKQAKELAELKSKLHEAVCAQAEQQGRLEAAEEQVYRRMLTYADVCF
jgi:hypothetical protein